MFSNMQGYISNVRVTKGTALHTTSLNEVWGEWEPHPYPKFLPEVSIYGEWVWGMDVWVRRAITGEAFDRYGRVKKVYYKYQWAKRKEIFKQKLQEEHNG